MFKEGNDVGTSQSPIHEPTAGAIVAAVGLALAGVLATRWPVLRPSAFDFDEVGYLQTIGTFRFPMHHTLFLASARAIGDAVGDRYRGFLLLDRLVSARALAAAGWWLRALGRPATAAATTLALGAAPVFWSYGAMAGNYTAIPLVGSLLLGLAYRGGSDPKPWHPYAAAVVLALGTGYRQDIGVLWLPVFLVILWQHRWIASAQAVLLFTALNLAWLAAMLQDVGGWEEYRRASARFAEEAGRKNSVWHLGVVDASLRYALKGSMALAWTLGPGLALVPRGGWRIGRTAGGGRLGRLLTLSVVPALASHLLIHFGVPGYAFHYVPALLALLAIGIGRLPHAGDSDAAPGRLVALATVLAGVFLLYPADFGRGPRRDFDLAIGRYSRVGLRTKTPRSDPRSWRTISSQELPGGRRASEARSLSGVVEATRRRLRLPLPPWR